MVRFIIEDEILRNRIEKAIYIPIWLDLLSKSKKQQTKVKRGFTFQYG